jgi:CDP-glycerol glycerophosphotransferase (TagB/SpsB family)
MSNNTVIISSFHPLVSRNILLSGILDLLTQKNIQIIILCPQNKKNYFDESFLGTNIKVVGIDMKPLSRMEMFWREIGNALLLTSTIRNNRRERYIRDNKFIDYYLFILINRIISRLPFIKHIYQFMSCYIYNWRQYEKIFINYKPTLVFSTDIFNDEDVRLNLCSRKLRILNIGMVRSWDNCTNKGILPVVPRTIVVHNKIIKKELKYFHGVNTAKINITGIPHFDYYFNFKPTNSDHFYLKTGFDKNKKIILFAPTGLKFVDDDYYILQLLLNAISSGVISGKPQILVRYPPGDSMRIENVSVPPNVKVFIDRPGVEFGDGILKNREISKDDMEWLRDSLYYSDILVSVGSTLCIDIAVFNKPIICPSINVDEVLPERSMVKMYNKYHYRYLLNTGGCEFVKSEEEFIERVSKALKNRNLGFDGRMVLLKQQLEFQDNLSSQRVVNLILSKLS